MQQAGIKVDDLAKPGKQEDKSPNGAIEHTK